jgi:hypothetical protein
MHRGSRPRGLRGTRGRAGLVSTVGPVLVGVIFAFAWNMAGSHGPGMAQPDPGLAPTVGTAVDQAADQAWASVMPSATRLPDRRISPPAVSGDRAPRRIRPPGKTASAGPASITAPLAHRRSGHSGTMVVVVPTRTRAPCTAGTSRNAIPTERSGRVMKKAAWAADCRPAPDASRVSTPTRCSSTGVTPMTSRSAGIWTDASFSA